MSDTMQICRNGHEFKNKQCEVCRRNYYLDNKAKTNQQNREWYQANKEAVINRTSKWGRDNPEKVKIAQKKSRCRPWAKEIRAEKVRQKRASDNLYRLAERCRGLAATAFRLKRISKVLKSKEMLGCDWETLDVHLMQTALDNYGVWSPYIKYHIDHVKALATAKTEEDLIKLCHYSNLQLLLPPDNMSKGTKPFDREALCSRKK